MLGFCTVAGEVVEGVTRATGCRNRTRDGGLGGRTGRSILTVAGGAKLVDSRPIRRGRGKGGHSTESKSTELLELLKLLKLVEGACCSGGLESGE